jgi:hypothetical protein
VIEYTHRLVSIIEGLTTEVEGCKEFYRMLRESMFVAIEEGQKIVAHLLCTRLPNSTKMIDYLVSTTKDLEKYKPSVSYKPVVLPVMQAKKVEKKAGKHEPSNTKHQKKNIFPPKDEENAKSHISPPPPPVHKKREEEGGFSPYENVPKQQPPERSIPVKKNLNTPPPPPIKEKKNITQNSQ